MSSRSGLAPRSLGLAPRSLGLAPGSRVLGPVCTEVREPIAKC